MSGLNSPRENQDRWRVVRTGENDTENVPPPSGVAGISEDTASSGEVFPVRSMFFHGVFPPAGGDEAEVALSLADGADYDAFSCLSRQSRAFRTAGIRVYRCFRPF
jgi:hypothetical protein